MPFGNVTASSRTTASDASRSAVQETAQTQALRGYRGRKVDGNCVQHTSKVSATQQQAFALALLAMWATIVRCGRQFGLATFEPIFTVCYGDRCR